ncbi:MAG: type II secretion system F family protein, partial [Thermodesulfobacteriaceae bacterium]|nr:type II secretion system F family protein [Thermodesulfobacteriaceae bacterium]
MEIEYKVADPTGKIFTGVLSAESLEQAKEHLKKKEYLILELKEKKERIYSPALFFKKRINEEILYSFFRELGILLKAGITIDKAFEILINSTSQPDFQKYLSNILKGLRQGKSVT